MHFGDFHAEHPSYQRSNRSWDPNFFKQVSKYFRILPRLYFSPRSRLSNLQLIIFHFILWNKNILEIFIINLRKNSFYIVGRKFLNLSCLLLLIHTWFIHSLLLWFLMSCMSSLLVRCRDFKVFMNHWTKHRYGFIFEFLSFC